MQNNPIFVRIQKCLPSLTKSARNGPGFVPFDLHLLTTVFPLVLAWCVHRCQTLKPKSMFVSFCASVWGCFHLCMNGLWLWGCTCPSVYVCVFVPACEWQRVLNMCWRSQRNSRALIRTSPRWQLVNSVLRKGVLYSCTKECKLVPMPSGHWEHIHMAHTLTLFWNTHWEFQHDASSQKKNKHN